MNSTCVGEQDVWLRGAVFIWIRFLQTLGFESGTNDKLYLFI